MDDEDDLVVRAHNGCDLAFAELFLLLYPQIWAFAMSRLNNAADAENVSQATFITYDRRRREPTAPKTVAVLKAWLRRTASHECQHVFRSRGRSPQQDSEGALDEVRDRHEETSPIEIDEMHILLRYHINRLEPMYQEILRIKCFEGLTFEKISVLLQVPEGTVEKRFYIAQTQLAESIRHDAALVALLKD